MKRNRRSMDQIIRGNVVSDQDMKEFILRASKYAYSEYT